MDALHILNAEARMKCRDIAAVYDGNGTRIELLQSCGELTAAINKRSHELMMSELWDTYNVDREKLDNQVSDAMAEVLIALQMYLFRSAETSCDFALQKEDSDKWMESLIDKKVNDKVQAIVDIRNHYYDVVAEREKAAEAEQKKLRAAERRKAAKKAAADKSAAKGEEG